MIQSGYIRISTIIGFALAGSLFLMADDLFGQDETSSEPYSRGPRCIIISDIVEATIESDRVIRISLRSNEQMSISLGEGCSQLKFHNFFTFQATGGQLCAEKSQVVSRSGETCPILSFDPLDLPALKSDDEPAPE